MQRCLLTTLAFLTMTSLVPAQESFPLFDGTSLDGWTTLDGKPVNQAWTMADGVLHLKSSKDQRGGHIITKQDYENFELSFEFKIADKGNSGIKYRVRDFGGKILGCEYQVYDHDADKKIKPNGLTASLYDIYEPVPADLFKPGEYNTGRIIVCNQHIEHWLNGRKVVEARVAGAEWFKRVGASKFKNVEGFGQTPFGRIMLTDHNSEAWYRNLRLRLLTPQYIPPANAPFEASTGGIVRIRKQN
jgi:hypothetical protein